MLYYIVWSKEESWTLNFITWPNETQAVVNETVKFLWKYYVKGKDVDIKWGTSKRISNKVSTFDKVFFYANEYEKYKNPIMSDDIPKRYRGRVQIVGQATLQIVNVTLEDEGEYLCEISDTGDTWTTLSRAVKLHVLSKCIYQFTIKLVFSIYRYINLLACTTVVMNAN